KVLYASTFQRRRTQCCMNGGGPGSGIWKSTDGGETWKRLTGGGLPSGPLGRIGLAVYRHSENIVYAEIQGETAPGGRGGGGTRRGGRCGRHGHLPQRRRRRDLEEVGGSGQPAGVLQPSADR